MKYSTHFTLLENNTELENWIKQQAKKCTRKVTFLQVHHTGAPSYANWKTDNALRRQENMRSFHIESGYGDIAQHLTIFPDGTVATGRSMNKNPTGIAGANTGGICIEIYGNFDKGKDIMNDKQKDAVIATYAYLCKYFKLTPSTNTIRAHAWYTYKGKYLGNYIAGRSTKTCPGTNFMGIGNTNTAFINKFYPLIKAYMNGNNDDKTDVPDYTAEVTVNGLNVRKGPGVNYNIIKVINKGDKVTVTYTNLIKSWSFVKLSDGKTGWVNNDYLKKVASEQKSYLVKINTKSLNVRKGPNVSNDIITTVKQDEVYTIVDEKDGWGLLKSYEKERNGWIKLSYTIKK